jgi:large subunit ribosomal protein L6
MAKLDLTDKVLIQEGVEVTIEGATIKVKGPQGELERDFYTPAVKISKEDNVIILSVKKAAKKQKMLMKTTKAHIKNMIKGTLEGYEYTLKICSGHFPMTVAFENDSVIVKNFLGESVPRKRKIKSDVKVVIKGNDITVNGIDIEKVGQAAASIEAITRMTNRDRRRFQDGIFITKKAGKEI